MLNTKTILPVLCLSLLATGVTEAVPKKKPAAARKPGGPIVLGTTQLAGDFGKLGTTYTIGKSAPLNFTLKSAEYTVAPFTLGNNSWVPKEDEKLLVLHYTVHNPQPRDQGYTWSDLLFTAVDALDKNHEFIQAVGREGTQQVLSQSLKPAQKIDVYSAIRVPANGEIPKLIVQRERGAPVIRFDLRGKVKKLPEGVADPADATGATARAEVPAKAGEFYPLGELSARLDSVAYTDEALLNREPGAGKRYATAIFTIKNATAREQSYYWGSFLPELIDADGEKVAYTQALLKATRNEKTDGKLNPGEEARVRFFFPLPSDVDAKTLKLALGLSIDQRVARTYAFDLGSATGTAAAAAAE